jgi:diaminohydroxyphosphoribosylaminopyrimidine deaminase/5-amino-6-(5-phosphoribosylamino)uracil reductase
MRNAGIDVTTGVLEAEGRVLLQNFQTTMDRKRPYVILKFVQSSDHFIGREDKQVWLSNSYEKVLVHKIRSEVDAIMVGTNTAILDDPMLTNRDYFGPHPQRVILDRRLRVPKDQKVYDGSIPTLIFTEQEPGQKVPNVELIHVDFDDQVIANCLKELYSREIQSVLVEGGAKLIQSFIECGLWDEAWVVTTSHRLEFGVKAPLLQGRKLQEFELEDDLIQVVSNPRR